MDISFWEQDAMLDADAIVIGGGLIGLQTALELRSRDRNARIVVLERGLLPAGASSRNAGFACFGSLTEILHDIDTMGEAAALAVIERRWSGLQRLRARLGDAAIGFENFGGYELLFDDDLPALERLDEVNRKLQPLFGQPVFSINDAGLRNSGFAPSVKTLVNNPFEAQVHSGRLMRALALLAAEQRIEIHTGAQVTAIVDDGANVQVSVGEQRALQFRAPRVAVCTNGISGMLIPDCDIVPARGQIIVTEPIADLRWRGTYHVDAGFYYFRNIGNRVLLGGARNLDFAGEQTSDMALSDTIQQALESMLRNTILPNHEVKIAQRWSGIMGFSVNKQPIVRRLSSHVVLGFGCNGMGVALGADIAAETAALLHTI